MGGLRAKERNSGAKNPDKYPSVQTKDATLSPDCFMRLPAVRWCDELPQWIISSNRACYHPFSNTIYIRKGLGLKTLLHEYIHWLGYYIGGRKCFLHRLVDGGKLNLK